MLSAIISNMDAITDSNVSKVFACLALGAYGDALGAPLSHLDREQILNKYKDNINQHQRIIGLKKLIPYKGSIGTITDITQLNLAMIDSLLLLSKSMPQIAITTNGHVVMIYGLLIWLSAQGSFVNPNYPKDLPSYNPELFSMINGFRHKTTNHVLIQTILNQSNPPLKSTNNLRSGQMLCRAIILGVFYAKYIDYVKVIDYQFIYDLASQEAALTFGHPTVTASSGLLAVIAAKLFRGIDFQEAIKHSLKYCQSLEAVDIVQLAIGRFQEKPSISQVLNIGVNSAEEILAVSLYAAYFGISGKLNLEDSLALAVSCGGYSSEIGSLTGSLIGIAKSESIINYQLIPNDCELTGLIPIYHELARLILE